MRQGYDGGHLGHWLEEYVDGTLEPQESRRVARHLLVCEPCRADVEAERAILLRLRAVQVDPERHACLVEGLLALSGPPADTSARASEPPHRANGAEHTRGHGSVALVSVAAPPQYRGERRRPVIVGVAAAAVCGVAFVTAHATPQRAAPGAPQVAHTTQARVDELAAPTVRVVGLETEAPGSVTETGGMRLKTTSSGRMGP